MYQILGEQTTSQVLWDGLKNRDFNPQELKKLFDALSSVEYETKWLSAYRREFAWYLGDREMKSNGPAKRWRIYHEQQFSPAFRFVPDLLITADWDDSAVNILNHSIFASFPSGWFKQRMALEIDLSIDFNKSATTFQDQRSRLWDLLTTEHPYDFLDSKMGCFSTLGFISTIIRSQVQIELAKTAIAFEQYFLKYHKYPVTFSKLVPEFLDAVPIDPWTDKPMLLDFRDDGRPVIYSVGPNLDDDGGIPTHPNSNLGDTSGIILCLLGSTPKHTTARPMISPFWGRIKYYSIEAFY